MLGFLFRLVGVFVLACAAALAVGDIARTLSAGTLRLQDFGSAIGLVTGNETAPLGSLGGVGAMLADLPAVPVIALLAVVLLLAGRRRAVVPARR